jgi:hypothetical protein
MSHADIVSICWAVVGVVFIIAVAVVLMWEMK